MPPASRLSKLWVFIRPLLILFFMLQPMVVFLGSYDAGNCDDKAFHFYAAMYTTSPDKTREQFQDMVEPVVQQFEHDPRWQRRAFWFSETATYPLANEAIPRLYQPGQHYTETVKWGLFTVTLAALLIVVLLSSLTPFGFWSTVLALNLVAFAVIRLDAIAPFFAGTHPFISYVPRGAAALMIIPIALAFAGRNRWLFGLSLLLTFLWHTALGFLFLGLTVTAAVLSFAVQRFQLLRFPLTYTLFAGGGVGGVLPLVSTTLLGGLLYFYQRTAAILTNTFYSRLFLLSALSLYLVTMASVVVSLPQVKALLRTVIDPFVVELLPERLTGVHNPLLVLFVIAGFRVFSPYFEKYWVQLRSRVRRLSMPTVVSAIILFLTINHLSLYRVVLARESAFFQPTCREARLVPLPEGLPELSLDDEPTLFASFGHYLFTHRDR